MDKNKVKSSNLNCEAGFYEFLGVRICRTIVLLIEKKLRRGRSNKVNYHPKDYSIQSLRSFTGYLLYNSACHVLSLALAGLYYLFTWVGESRYLFFDLIVFVLVVVNLYCIMLQRYSYLKLKACLALRENTRRKQMKSHSFLLQRSFLNRERKEMEEEYQLLCRIHSSVQHGTDCFLVDEDTPILERLAEYGRKIVKPAQKSSHYRGGKETLSSILEEGRRHPFVFSKIELWASRLQKLLSSKKQRCESGFDSLPISQSQDCLQEQVQTGASCTRKERRGIGPAHANHEYVTRSNQILFGYGIIIDSERCERAFGRLFSTYSRESLEYLLEVFLETYKSCLFVGEGGVTEDAGVDNKRIQPS